MSEFIINLNIATKKYDKQIDIEKIKTNKERRKTSEDDGKQTIPRIKNERVVGGNTADNELVKKLSSKSHNGKENIHTITHQPQHKKFSSTLTTDGKKTIISHEPLTGESFYFLLLNHHHFQHNHSIHIPMIMNHSSIYNLSSI